ncbi:2,3,4,5-tetrahydropyridine-2,6-dicarboxylate N-acetyltransferase, partial [Enterococcus faecium]
LKEVTFPETIKVFNNCKTGTLFGDWADVKPFLEANKEKIEDYVVENDARNSAIPFLDLKDINARIEPGALIREKVEIGDQAVIMM